MNDQLKRDVARVLVDIACMDLDANYLCPELHSVIRRWVDAGGAGATLLRDVLRGMDERAKAGAK